MVEDIRIIGIKYKYKLISAPEIINSKRGVLNLGNVIPKVESKTARRYTNRQMIEEFLEDMAGQGWDYCNQILYEGLPNNGCLLFRRELTTREEENVKGEQSLAALATEYEGISSANAIWRDKKTKGFKEFLRKKGYDFSVELGQEVPT